MHWIYIIKCENDIIYIGETKNLYKRLNQHKNNNGSKHTIENKPIQLIGIYKVHSQYRFLLYCREIEKEKPNIKNILKILNSFNEIEWNNKDWARMIEDYICEYLLYKNFNVFGGKYINDNKNNINKQFDVEELIKVPLCKCNIPCKIECVKNSKYYKLYFTCSAKNIWNSMRSDYKNLELNKGCNFYIEYMDGIEYRLIQDQVVQEEEPYLQ